MNLKQAQQVILCIFIMFAGSQGLAVDTSSVISPKLSTMTLEVNGERLIAPADSTVEVVRGDLVMMVDGLASASGTVKLDSIDVIGFASQRQKPSRDDRSFVINTATDLQSKFASDSTKTIFEVRGFVGEKIVGSIRIKLVEPRLDRVEISLNGTPYSLKDGETLNLKASDKIAVRSVSTNVRGNENVRHELKVSTDRSGAKKRELVFARGGQIFGRIPIQWQE